MPRQFPILEARRCQGVPVAQAGEMVVYAKPLEDAGRGALQPRQSARHDLFHAPFAGHVGRQKTLRDVWHQQDIGIYDEKGRSDATAPHGVLLLRISPCNSRERVTQGR